MKQDFTDEEVEAACEKINSIVMKIEEETGNLRTNGEQCGDSHDHVSCDVAQQLYLTSKGIKAEWVMAVVGFTTEYASKRMMEAITESEGDIEKVAEVVEEVQNWTPLMAFLVGHAIGREVLDAL